jgi:CDP-diglyceride synthetase
MKTRVITAIVAIVILVCILVFSATPVLPLAAMICALIAVYEITGCVDIRKKWALSLTTYIFSVAILVLVFVHFLNYLTIPNFTAVLFAVLYIYVFLIFALTMFSKGTIAFSQAAELIALTFYILIGFISIVLLRNVEPAGKYIYLLLFRLRSFYLRKTVREYFRNARLTEKKNIHRKMPLSPCTIQSPGKAFLRLQRNFT